MELPALPLSFPPVQEACGASLKVRSASSNRALLLQSPLDCAVSVTPETGGSGTLSVHGHPLESERLPAPVSRRLEHAHAHVQRRVRQVVVDLVHHLSLRGHGRRGQVEGGLESQGRSGLRGHHAGRRERPGRRRVALVVLVALDVLVAASFLSLGRLHPPLHMVLEPTVRVVLVAVMVNRLLVLVVVVVVHVGVHVVGVVGVIVWGVRPRRRRRLRGPLRPTPSTPSRSMTPIPPIPPVVTRIDGVVGWVEGGGVGGEGVHAEGG